MLSAAEILDIAIIDQDFAECTRQLELTTAHTHCTSNRGAQLTESEKCLDEALWYARRGEQDEAIFRLHQAEQCARDEPADDEHDWSDEEFEECNEVAM